MKPYAQIAEKLRNFNADKNSVKKHFLTSNHV